MGVSGRALAEGEDVVYHSRPHWMMLGWPLVWVVAVAVVAVVLLAVAPGAPVTVAYGLAVVGAVVVVWLAGRSIRWATTTVAVTTMRVIERTGVLSRRGTEIRLDRIAELSYRQSLLGMVLGGGQLQIDIGAGGAAILHDVRRPAQLQSIVTEQIAACHRSAMGSANQNTWWADTRVTGWSTPPAGTAAVTGKAATDSSFEAKTTQSAADRLTMLADLHRRGLVNDGEFAAKRAEILRQL